MLTVQIDHTQQQELSPARPFGRPKWRGRMHSWAALVAVPAGLFLLISVDDSRRLAAVIYLVAVIIGFATSAAYHRLTRTEPARSIMQRLDHSMIYMLVVGTYTPLLLHSVNRARGLAVLVVVIVLAFAGASLKMLAFHRARRLSDALYALMGWGGLFASGLADYLSPTEFRLFLAGSLLYSLGLPILATQRPDPWPRIFGYHEVWHAASITAAGLHFVVIASVLTS